MEIPNFLTETLKYPKFHGDRQVRYSRVTVLTFIRKAGLFKTLWVPHFSRFTSIVDTAYIDFSKWTDLELQDQIDGLDMPEFREKMEFPFFHSKRTKMSYFDAIPEETTENILSYVKSKDWFNVMLVCKKWKTLGCAVWLRNTKNNAFLKWTQLHCPLNGFSLYKIEGELDFAKEILEKRVTQKAETEFIEKQNATLDSQERKYSSYKRSQRRERSAKTVMQEDILQNDANCH